jgi:pyrroline-5-carboxylate reductase
MVRLQIVGGGKMGEALLQGLFASGWIEPKEVAIVERLEARRNVLADLFPGAAIVGHVVPCEGAVVAVKPDDVVAAAEHLGRAGVERVLSIAAGVTIAKIEAALPNDTAVIRSMPNTPALVGAGASAIAGGSDAGPADLEWAEEILGAVGIVVRTKESLLDAVTGVSGSGPGYVFLVAEALIEAGVLVGLPRDVATKLAGQTLLGSARLLLESGESPADLRAAVTSPGGTTAAGLRALEDGGVRSAILAAVDAATKRAQELGQA